MAEKYISLSELIKKIRLYMCNHCPDRGYNEKCICCDVNICLEIMCDMKSEDVFKKGYVEQIVWERNVAIEQLHSSGFEFGEKTNAEWIVGNFEEDNYEHHKCSMCQKFAPYDYIYTEDTDYDSGGEFYSRGMIESGVFEHITKYCPNCGRIMVVKGEEYDKQ